MSNARARAWRKAFQPLKDPSLNSSAFSLFHALQQLFSDSATLISAASSVPPQEMAKDVTLLVEYASKEALLSEHRDSFAIVNGTCHLILELSYRSQFQLKPPFLVHIIDFLSGIVEKNYNSERIPAAHKDAVDLCSKSRLAREALQSLAHIIHESGVHLLTQNVSTIIDFLLSLLLRKPLHASPSSSKKIQYANDLNKNQRMDTDIELQTLAFVAMSNIFFRNGSAVSSDSWRLITEALRKIMDILASKSNLEEDRIMSRYYAAFLRCLQSVLSDPKGSISEHVPGFVVALQKFFSYGLSRNRFKTVCWHHVNDSHEKNLHSKRDMSHPYRPPHLRGPSSVSHEMLTIEEKTGPIQRRQSFNSAFSSDSEHSDTDGALKEVDFFKSSKVRTAAFYCIQALCRAEPKSLHAHWTMLLPTHDVLQPWPHQTTLMTCLLFDPILKTRMAAAATLVTMLEGPSSAFLQVAEFKGTTKSGSFTALSSLIGQTLMQLHEGILYLVLNESNGGILMMIFKALSLLVSATPYNRLPQHLLLKVISSMCKKATDLLEAIEDQSSIVAAAINCIGAVLSVNPSIQELETMLEAQPTSVTEDRQALLPMLFSFTSHQLHPAVRFEALQALRAAAHSYPSVMTRFWKEISLITFEAIESSLSESSAQPSSVTKGALPSNFRPTDDKTILSAIKLLDEVLRCISGFKGTDDFLDDSPSESFQSLLPKPIKHFASLSQTRTAHAQLTQSAAPGTISGHDEWSEALEMHLPLALGHSAPMVRAAALTCFAGLTSSVFFSLPSQRQDFIIVSVVMAASKDEVPSVRSAACRAIGVIASFPCISASLSKLEELLDVILCDSVDSSVSVRITASWALANICDSFRHIAGSSTADKYVIIDDPSLISLLECALQLSRDGDKIKANAVRALGNLSRFVNFSNKTFTATVSQRVKETSHKTNSLWLEKMVNAFVSCVTTGNVKVQWNVCRALGNLFLNKSIELCEMTWTTSVYSILLLLLRDSLNFKIRIHAAAALAVPTKREDYGDSFVDILQALIHVLETLNTDHVVSSSSLRYRQALAEQMTITTLHVLGLVSMEDCKNLSDFFSKKALFLEDWLISLCAKLKNVVQFEDSEDQLCAEAIHTSSIENGEVTLKSSPVGCSGNKKHDLLENKVSEYCSITENCKLREETSARKISILKAIRSIILSLRFGSHQHLVANFEDIVLRFDMIES